MQDAFSRFAFNAIDLGQGHILRCQFLSNQTRTINERMRHGAACVGLECNGGPNPRLAKVFHHGLKVAVGGVGKTMEQTVMSLKHGGGSFEASLRHAHRSVRRLRRPAWVHALGP